MALSVVALDPEAFFGETEIKLHLSAFLNGIASQDVIFRLCLLSALSDRFWLS